MRAIACVTPDWKIGKWGDLLYHIPEDMERFKELTTTWVGDPVGDCMPSVVMGMITYCSLPYTSRPLKGRHNYVLTRDSLQYSDDYFREGVTVVEDINTFMTKDVTYNDNIWVIGGGQIYNRLLPYCTEFYLTRVDVIRTDADVAMPNLLDPKNGFELVKKENKRVSHKAQVIYNFEVYRNIALKQEGE